MAELCVCVRVCVCVCVCVCTASHMETRVLSLLKKLYHASKHGPGKGPPGGRQRGGPGGADKPNRPKVPRPPKQPGVPKGKSPDTATAAAQAANHTASAPHHTHNSTAAAGGQSQQQHQPSPAPPAAPGDAGGGGGAAGPSGAGANGVGGAAGGGGGAGASGFPIKTGRDHNDRGSRAPPASVVSNLNRNKQSSSKRERDGDNREYRPEKDRAGRDGGRDGGRGGGRSRPDEPSSKRAKNTTTTTTKPRDDSKSKPNAAGSSKPSKTGGKTGAGASQGNDNNTGGVDVHELLETVAPQIKSWRHLGEDKSLDDKEVVRRMMECLTTIGEHVEVVVTQQVGHTHIHTYIYTGDTPQTLR